MLGRKKLTTVKNIALWLIIIRYMPTPDIFVPADYNKILTTNSDVVGKKWWSSKAKVNFETTLGIALAYNPITLGLIISAMAGSVVFDQNVPLTNVPFEHPKHGRGFKTKVTSMVPCATDILRERLAKGETLYDIRESGDGGVVTPYGHFLRKNSIDELTQFHNVLMKSSKLRLVGPRDYGIDEFIYNIKPKLKDSISMQTFINHLEDGLSFGVLGLASVFDRHAPLERRFATENIYAEKSSWIGDIRIMAGVRRLSRITNGV